MERSEILNFKGKDFLPLKSAATLFKGKTQWYPVAGKVIFQFKNQKITFEPDSRAVSIGNKKISLSAPCRIVKGKVFVPVDFFLTPGFTEVSECKITWDSANLILVAEPRISLFTPRIYSRASSTRLVIEATEPISPAIRKKGRKMLVDIPKVRIAQDEEVRVKGSVIERVKLAQEGRGVSVKLDLARDVTDYSHTVQEEPHRLVLELFHARRPEDEEDEKFKEIKLPATQTAPALPAAVRSEPRAAAAAPARVKKIVIDAGHGGKDPGALGATGTKEKDINLLLALELARVLRVEGGYEVLLTRSDDTFVSLLDRTIFANQQGADLFVSIHCNASLQKSRGGFEIYFLADEASDPHAEAAAEFENAVIEMDDHHATGKEKVQELLSSMARTEFINESALLCSTIARAVEKRAPVENRGVKRANFHVLHGAEMPSVLVEAAFLTRRAEEKNLRKKNFRSALVDAIFTGIENYQAQLRLLRSGKL